MPAADDHPPPLPADLGAGRTEPERRLLTAVYQQLHALASRQLRGERAGHTLQATALVHEAYVKLGSRAHETPEERAGFLAAAAQAMRRILVDHARARRREKRGGGRTPLSLDEELVLSYERHADLVELDELLARLGDESARMARIVEMRFFGGMTMEEIGQALGISVPTAQRDWRYARAWLYRALGAGDEPPAENPPRA